MIELMVVANPVSNHGRSYNRFVRVMDLLKERGIQFDFRVTASASDVEKEARDAAGRGVPLVLVAGGDGTLHHAANGLAGTDTVMGVIPCGRGNDLARTLDIPKDPVEIVDAILNGKTESVDLGRVGNRYFVTVATLGFDSAVSAEAAKPHPRIPRKLNYTYSLLRTLMRYRCPKVRLEGDFGVFEGDIFLCATANTPYYGGGMKIAPDAAHNNALLQVCLIKSLSRLKAAVLFPSVFKGRHIRFREVTTYAVRSVEASSDVPLAIYADGEPICNTPARMEIVPGALKVRMLNRQVPL